MSPRVLVTDGEYRAALACVRSLGRAGYSCFVIGPGKGDLAGASRHCRGSAALTDPGVDFPALLLQCAQGDPPSSPVIGKPGVQTRWLLGDLDQLIRRLTRPRKTFNVSPSFPGRGRAILDFLWDFRPGVHLEVLKASDPRPFLVEDGAWLRVLGGATVSIERESG